MALRCGCVRLSICGGILLKSVTGVWPRSTPMMNHRPPSDFCSSWVSKENVLLRRWALNFKVKLQPPSMCVLVRGDCHLEQVRDVPCFRRHLCIWTLHMTYIVSRRDRYDVFE